VAITEIFTECGGRSMVVLEISLSCVLECAYDVSSRHISQLYRKCQAVVLEISSNGIQQRKYKPILAEISLVGHGRNTN
jgi:hypothetical protein